MDEFNPYTAPEAAVSPGMLGGDPEEGRGVWRDGKVLVMSKHARLPSRCVRCNGPATNRLTMKLSWHHPALYLLWLLFPLGLLIYLVLMLIERRAATIEVPLCQGHRAGRSRGLLVAWVVAPLGLALLILGFAYSALELPIFVGNEDLAMLLLITSGITLTLVGLTYGVSSAQVVSARRVDKKHVWLNKVCRGYLAALPALPGSEAAGEAEGDRKPTDSES